jgi:branched-chain amino acid transport system permease protein
MNEQDIVWQLFVNSLIAASGYYLVALSFSIIYSTNRFFHFAHAGIFTVGAYSAFTAVKVFNWPIFQSLIFSLTIAAFLGILIEICVYKKLRDRRASPLVLLIASLGLYVIIQNAISMIFGVDTKSVRTWQIHEGINLFGARITPVQVVLVMTSVIIAFLTIILFKKSKLGFAMKAIADDSELARISGVNTDLIVLWTFALGSALAGLAGVLIALDVDMTPTMGLRALLMGVVAMIIGGVRSVIGIALGALLLGGAQNFGVLKISSQWQDAIAFIVLLILLLLKPEGFLGKRTKKVSV